MDNYLIYAGMINGWEALVIVVAIIAILIMTLWPLWINRE